MGSRILKSKRILFNLTQEEIAKELGITIKSYNLKEMVKGNLHYMKLKR